MDQSHDLWSLIQCFSKHMQAHIQTHAKHINVTFGTWMDCGTAGGEGTESDSIITHSDTRPADVPAVRCVRTVPCRQLQSYYITPD